VLEADVVRREVGSRPASHSSNLGRPD
jgi:hypothetical protein